MDIEEDPDLIYGDELCFPAITTYYANSHAPPGINVPAEFYGRPTISGINDQGLHYMGHQAEGTSCMYYVVPNYATAHPSHGPHPSHPVAHPPHGPHPSHLVAHPHGSHPSHPCAITNDGLSGVQERCAETVERTYYQQVRTPHYVVPPSVAERIPPINVQPLAQASALFLPCGRAQTIADATKRSVAWSPSLQSASASSMKFQNHTVPQKRQLHGTVPWKRQLADRSRLPDKLLRIQQASRRPRHSAVPSVQTSLQANLSYNNHVSSVGSDFYKTSVEKSYPRSKTSSHANRRTDQYNRDDFKVVYPNAKFFVIKSFSEADVHKSIKYGVWSTSSVGNKKLDSAFREAQVIAASDSTSCPIFLFFSVNQSFCFCGVAEMVGPVDWQKNMDFWCNDKWIGSFPVKWHIIKDVCNSTFQGILLQNNEDKPVTSSYNTQEIHYTTGTTMLKIFKYARADECLLDEFMMLEEEEAKTSQRRRLKLRQAAPQFVPASMHARHSYNTVMPKFPQLMPGSMHAHHTYNPMLPKPPQFMPASMHAHETYNTLLPPRSDSVVMNRITRETNDLTGKLQGLNLDTHQRSCQEFGSVTGIASTTNTHSYGIQAHKNVVKAMTYQAYQPLTSNVKPTSDGEQQCGKKVEITPAENSQVEAATSLSFDAPEEYPNGGKTALVDSASEVSGMISEEQKIFGKPCSLATDSESSQACSKPRAVAVAIGSMLVPITISIE
ncbi:hypothetical protein QOZ80_5BG0452240 [Eleusine coracana subsp. coracana]|nr:hypothetical protein QOZ80_5BG0452240 [Eleusine coracana subsp. coracana]